MGYYTTIIILNDYLNNIRDDKEFGEKLRAACLESVANDRGTMISCPGVPVVGRAFTSYDTRNVQLLLLSDHNCKLLALDKETNTDLELSMLKQAANKLGYKLVKRKSKV